MKDRDYYRYIVLEIGGDIDRHFRDIHVQCTHAHVQLATLSKAGGNGTIIVVDRQAHGWSCCGQA